MVLGKSQISIGVRDLTCFDAKVT